MNSFAENWAAQVRAGEVRAISRALTAVENGDEAAQLLLRELFPSTGRAWRIGITGAGGTGKSTLVSSLAAHYRALGKAVGVIAVDPSSPFTGGAILGDRVRMQSHATDDGVFIRSMASRGAWGGLAQATADAALLLDAAGKESIFVETVGVGQDEIEIARVADCTIVVLAPGAGDEIQALKAGLLEIADVFVLNKADHDAGGDFAERISDMFSLGSPRGAWQPKVIRTVATEGKGVEELAQEIDRFRDAHAEAHHRHTREVEYWKNWLLRFVHHRMIEQITRRDSTGRRLDEIASAIASRETNPYAAAEQILNELSASGGKN